MDEITSELVNVLGQFTLAVLACKELETLAKMRGSVVRTRAGAKLTAYPKLGSPRGHSY